jgi:hypothetical protein
VSLLLPLVDRQFQAEYPDQVLMDAVQALDDDALQLVESSIIPNLRAWGYVRALFKHTSALAHPAAHRLIPDDS